MPPSENRSSLISGEFAHVSPAQNQSAEVYPGKLTRGAANGARPLLFPLFGKSLDSSKPRETPINSIPAHEIKFRRFYDRTITIA